MPSLHTLTTTIATDVDTATPTETAQQLDRDVITAIVWTTSQPYADLETIENIESMTDKADTVRESPHRSRVNRRSSGRSSCRSSSKSRSHNRCTRRYRRRPTPHHIDTITITRPNTAENSDSDEDEPKPRRRPATPHPHVKEIFTTDSDSNIDAGNTDSEMSFTIYSQDEGSLSTDDTTPRNYHIPMTPPKTHKTMLPRPSCIPVLQTLNITKDQQNKDNT